MTSRSECIGLLFSLSIDETVFFNDARFVNLKKEKLYKIVKKKQQQIKFQVPRKLKVTSLSRMFGPTDSPASKWI